MINRIRKQKGYTVVDNGYLYDPSLTLDSVGLLTVIFSYPDGKHISIESIADTRPNDSTYRVRSAMRELIKAGYCIRSPHKGEGGKFVGWDYTVFEEKQEAPADLRNTSVGYEKKSTDLRNTDVRNSSVLISTITSNTIDSSKDYTSIEVLESIVLSSTGEKSSKEDVSEDFLGLGDVPTNPKKERKSSAKKKEKAELSLIPIPHNLNTPEFVEAWTRLNSISKWRNKPASAVELALQKLSHYEVAFAVELCDAAHAGNYQGVVFPDTQSKYEQWKKRNAHDQNTRSNGQNIGFRERALADIAELDAKFARTNTR